MHCVAGRRRCCAGWLGKATDLSRFSKSPEGVLDFENTRTPAARDTAWREFVTGTLGRLMPGGRVWMVGTAWHTDDLLHRAARLDGWRSRRFPVLDDAGSSVWPHYFPAERIEARRLELGPVAFEREMMCRPIDEASIVFGSDAIDLAMLQGRDPRFTARGSCRIVIGVDPAWTTSASADESAIVMVAIDDFGNRHLTHVEAGRWHHEQLASRVVELSRANRATVYCESNGAGGVIADMIGRRAPCKPLPTTRTSKQARVEALSAELASGRWCFSQPLGQPSADLKRLCDELATFSFDTHCGDRLAALLIAVEGCRALESRPRMRWHHLDLTTR